MCYYLIFQQNIYSDCLINELKTNYQTFNDAIRHVSPLIQVQHIFASVNVKCKSSSEIIYFITVQFYIESFHKFACIYRHNHTDSVIVILIPHLRNRNHYSG